MTEGRRSGWWLASDGNYYPPELHPDRLTPPTVPGTELDRAGASAAEEADRLAEAAEAQRLESEQWAKGAAGERATAAALAQLDARFVVFHDLHVPGSPANVDHLVIGPTGVFVVDSKAYSGTFTLSAEMLWRGRYPIRREVDTLEFITNRVAGHLNCAVRPVLCFTEAALPERRVQLGATTAVGLGEVVALICDSPQALSADQIAWLATLAGQLVEPVEISPTATETYELQPSSQTTSNTPSRRPPSRRRTPSAKRTPQRQPSGRRRKQQPSFSSILFGLIATAVAVFVVVPFVINSMTSAVTSQTATTTPDGQPQAGIDVQFTCPVPGGWYSATFVRPGGASTLDQYKITVVVNGLELPPQVSRSFGDPPEPVPALAPGTPIEVRTTSSRKPNTAPNIQQLTAPAQPC